MPTVKDIARECGVSANTVSSVLNNKPGEVSTATRARILDAVRRLGYRPNAAARRMLGKRTNTIGIADRFTLSRAPNSYKAQILERIMNAARGAKWDILYYSGHINESGFTAFLDGRSEGLICFTGNISQDDIAAIIETKLPVVFIGRRDIDTLESRGAIIDVDNEAGGYLAGAYLADLGHTRFAMIQGAGIAGNLGRISGFRRALEERGLHLDESLIIGTKASEEEGYEHGMTLLSLPKDKRPTACFCFNDSLALGLIEAAKESNINVPDALSVVGFDDVLISAISSPPLTTIRQPLAWIGNRAVEILFKIISGELPLDHQEVARPELITRGSAAPKIP